MGFFFHPPGTSFSPQAKYLPVADLSPPSTAKVQIEFSKTFTPPYTSMACTATVLRFTITTLISSNLRIFFVIEDSVLMGRKQVSLAEWPWCLLPGTPNSRRLRHHDLPKRRQPLA